jgi:uncharacterized repeat protein (TIGR01451 family)
LRIGPAVLVLAAALRAEGGEQLPAGLTREDWSQIRRSIHESGPGPRGSADATSQFVPEAQLLGHGDPLAPNDWFGYSVAVSGDTAVVGAPRETVAGSAHRGAAYVFVRSGTAWSLQQKLAASDGAPDDEFGHSVAVSGDTALIGAWMDDTPAGGSAGSVYVFLRSGTAWQQFQKLLPSDGGIFDVFGASVSIDGDTAVVGAFRADTAGGPDAGAAYVFARSGFTWSEQQKLTASDGAGGDWFGNAVSVSVDTAVIGAITGGFGNGAAYVFVRSGTSWTQQQKLLASDGALNDAFGCAVSVDGSTAVIGAYLDDTPGGMDAGSAYAFVRAGTTWTQQQKLLASDGLPGDWFGWAVSVSGDTAAVGARQDDNVTGLDAGSAYVFVRAGTLWTEQQRLQAPDGSSFDYLGVSVAVSGDTLLAGAPFDDIGTAADAGSAYLFVRAGTVWSLQQKLSAQDTGSGDLFGSAVAVYGETAVVGSPNDATATAGPGGGSAYVFVRSGTTWSEQQKLVPSDGAPADRFGTAVAVWGDTLVVGAVHGDSPGGSGTGAAYVFVRSGTTWTEQQKLVASDGATGDRFGESVALSGETVVIGADYDDTAGGADTGSAYVFVRSGTTWTQQQKLTAADGASGDSFGYGVAVSGETALIGAFRDDTPGGMDAGSAYVFVRSGTAWSQQQKIVAPDGMTFDYFGASVSLSWDTAAVGAPFDDGPGLNLTDMGSAYVFVRTATTWSLQQKLQPSDGANSDFFGSSVALAGDLVVVGAPFADTIGGTDAGAAYAFRRSGTVWNEEQKLVAPDGGTDDWLGSASAIFAETVVVGARFDDTAAGLDAGSAHVFRQEVVADLAVTKSDGLTSAVPGESLTYTVTATNGGPSAAAGAVVLDAFPAALTGVTWTCTASGGASCAAGGAGNIADAVNLPVGGAVSYTATGTVLSGATGTLTNTATVAPPPGGTDPDPANDTATDTDVLAPEADLSVVKTDSADPVSTNDPLVYVLTVTNGGPSDGTGVTAVDTLPAGVTFVSSVPGPPQCTLAGVTLTCDLATLAAGSNATVSINTVVTATGGMLVNTASVSATEPDPDPGNNTASATTFVGLAAGELAHGTEAVHDLAAQAGPVADADVFRINQKPYSSYEIVVDATSGDIGAGNGPFVERIAADGTTVLQDSRPIGTGSSRSLRWRNTTSGEIEEEAVRVRSAGCTTDCGPDDVYRIRAYETTYSVPRFNNAGTQVTVLVLQNPTNYAIAGGAYFRTSSGTLVGTQSFNLGPKATVVLNTATIPGANGVSGAITVAHDGRYGDLSGKTVALEPATGFSFDSPLVPRIR